MANPGYKTAKQLGITSLERRYLIEFVESFERGAWMEGRTTLVNGRPFSFYMAEWSNKVANLTDKIRNRLLGKRGYGECEAVGCIAGYVWTMADRDGRADDLPYGDWTFDTDAAGYGDYRSENDQPLKQLYFPDSIKNYDRVTLPQAVAATRAFLRTGKPKWPSSAGSPE